MNSLVVFRHNCLPLLGCGFNCIFKHSQRLLLLQGLHIGFCCCCFFYYYSGYMVMAIPIHLSVHNCVCECV